MKNEDKLARLVMLSNALKQEQKKVITWAVILWIWIESCFLLDIILWWWLLAPNLVMVSLTLAQAIYIYFVAARYWVTRNWMLLYFSYAAVLNGIIIHTFSYLQITLLVCSIPAMYAYSICLSYFYYTMDYCLPIDEVEKCYFLAWSVFFIMLPLGLLLAVLVAALSIPYVAFLNVRAFRAFQELYKAVALTEDKLLAPLLALEQGTLISDQKWYIDSAEIEMLETLGAGSFGKVRRCKWRGLDLAIKTLHEIVLDDEVSQEEFIAEISVLERLNHPNILSLIGASADSSDLFLVTEFCAKGSLFSMISLNPDQLRDPLCLLMCARQIAEGVAYLHQLSPPIIHRDLKSLNVFLTDNMTVKVGDFGLARELHELKNATMAGTPEWTAPEVLQQASCTESADVFSFAVIIWEILMLEEPYKGMSPTQVTIRVARDGLRPTLPSSCDVPARESLPFWDEYVALMEACWSQDPSRRPLMSVAAARLAAMEKRLAG